MMLGLAETVSILFSCALKDEVLARGVLLGGGSVEAATEASWVETSSFTSSPPISVAFDSAGIVSVPSCCKIYD